MGLAYDDEGIAEFMGLSLEREPADAVQPGVSRGGVLGCRGLHDVGDRAERVGCVLPLPPLSVEKAVEDGLPREVLRHVAERIAGGDKVKVAALEWSIVPKTTLERRHTRLSSQESERTERVARLFVHARRALGSEDEARAFVTASHPELDGRSPLEAARTDLGTRRAERILNALEYGLAF